MDASTAGHAHEAAIRVQLRRRRRRRRRRRPGRAAVQRRRTAALVPMPVAGRRHRVGAETAAADGRPGAGGGRVLGAGHVGGRREPVETGTRDQGGALPDVEDVGTFAACATARRYATESRVAAEVAGCWARVRRTPYRDLAADLFC